jgi:hypothetical protein
MKGGQKEKVRRRRNHAIAMLKQSAKKKKVDDRYFNTRSPREET